MDTSDSHLARELINGYWDHLQRASKLLRPVVLPQGARSGVVLAEEVDALVQATYELGSPYSLESEVESPPVPHVYVAPDGVTARDLLLLSNLVLNVGRWEGSVLQPVIATVSAEVAELPAAARARVEAYPEERLRTLVGGDLDGFLAACAEEGVSAFASMIYCVGLLEVLEREGASDVALRDPSEVWSGPVQELAVADPRRFAGYSLRGRLGSTHMSTVFLGRSAADADGRSEWVAIKCVSSNALHGAGDLLTRARKEASNLARIQSPSMPRFLGFGSHADQFYIVTEALPHPNMSAIVNETGGLPLEQLWSYGRGLASALDAVHAADVVHRDMNPKNVLWNGTRPFLVDLGISASVDGTRMTETGSAVGTPGYLAPEVLRSPDDGVLFQSDIWGWGALMWHAATGRHAFSAPLEVLATSVDPAVLVTAGVPAALRDLILRCLSSEPGQRPKDGADLIVAVSDAHLTA